MRVSTRIFAGLLLLATAPAISAQTDVFPNLWITDARVEGMAILGDTVFVAGRFDYAGPPTGQLAVLDKTTGEADLSQPRFSALGLSLNGITDILPDGAGGYYASGYFSFVSSQRRLALAHVLPDGTLDQSFQPDPATPSGERANVFEIALDRDAASPSGAGVLYVGGNFATIGGEPRAALAALDARTGAVLPFNAALGRPSGSSPAGVGQLLVLDGVVYANGGFETVAGQPKPNAVAFDGVTGALLPWGASPNGPASPVAAGDGTVYLYGDFTSVNGQPRPFLAEVSLYDPATGGGALTPWRAQAEVFGDDFEVTPNALWAVGYVEGLSRIDRTSGAVTLGQPPCERGRTLAYDPPAVSGATGTLFTGCERQTSGSGDYFPYVVGLDPDTGQPNGFDVMGATSGNSVRALAVDSGRILVGGTFVTFGAGVTRRNGLAAFDLTTGLPTAFGQGDFAGFEDLALSPDGRFLYAFANLVGGAVLALTEFDLATGTTRSFAQSRRPEPTPMNPSARAEALLSPPPILRSNPRVENATSAFVVTDDGQGGGRVCVSVAGVACYDRTTTDLLFYTGFSTVTAQGENNGDLLYLPPGGPIVGPGGAQGTLYLAAPIERSGTPDLRRPALAAIDYATGDVIAAWEPGFRFAGAEGYSLALLDPDGATGPQPASLYGGGDRDWTIQGNSLRSGLAAFDPQTAALRPWVAQTSGGPALSMAAHRSPGGAGVVYVGGSFGFTNGVRRACCVAAFDAVTGAYREDWQPFGDFTFVMVASEQHDAIFLGGFGQALRGTGHSGLVAVSPASPILPTAGEAGSPEAPPAARLALAGPNPFRSQTALSLSLPEAQAVEASLFDVLGRRVAVLHDGVLAVGTHTLAVDASALPAGVYVARVVAGTFAEALTLTVVR